MSAFIKRLYRITGEDDKKVKASSLKRKLSESEVIRQLIRKHLR